MDKKEITNITIQQMRELVARESWVKTPFRYTELGAGLSLIQQQAMLMVSGHLQTYIKDFYNLHLDRSKNRPKALFSEHVLKTGIPPFKIWLADLGVQPNNYNAAREAIEEINLQVEHPELDENGHETGRTLLTNVFSQFGFEETGEYYHFGEENEDGEKKAVKMKNPYIDVKINPDVALWAFDMSQGYVNHLKMIASYSSKRSTPRLYLMLMNRTKKGEKEVTIPLMELKTYLGIVPYKDEKTGEMVVPYPKFANFKQKVLEAVKQDLERMAALDPPKTDITFTYEPVYPGTRKKGDPEAIKFFVERTVLGDAYNVVVNHKPSELIKKPVQQEMFSDEYEQIWANCLDDICENVKDEQIREKFRLIHFESFTKADGLLMLQIPDVAYHQWLESDKVLKFFYSFLSKHFGKDIKLNYRLPKKKEE
jgi:hypothetical protein